MASHSKNSRDHAEVLFSRTQTQALSRNRIISEQDAATDAVAAKTARLREQRLEREAAETPVAAKKPATTKGKR